MIDWSRMHPRRWNLRLLWDLAMVWLAVINITLIVFDLTYLLLRPTYVRYAPPLARLYDPVLRIEPHPLTERLLQEADEIRRLLDLDPGAAGLEDRVERLRALSARVLVEDPFDRSGQARTQEVFRVLLAEETGRSVLEMGSDESLRAAAAAYWTTDPAVLDGRLAAFESRMTPLLRINYFRELDVRGRPVSFFWLIDLPFLTVFLAEFLARWWIAVRRRVYARWFFFPILHWYDALGLIPLAQFRIFRLFRIASMYMRLRRSELTRVGKDALSRAVAYVSNIIAEEISDTVALRILSETQDEIRDGTHRRIFEDTVLPRRDRIGEVATSQIGSLLASEPIRERLRGLLRINLENAVDSSTALRAVPLPDAVLRPVVRGVGEVLLESTLETLTQTLETDEGRQALRDLVASILEQVFTGPWRREIEDVSQQIGLDVLEQMKAAVAVKKWSQPDRQQGPDRPAD